MDDETDEHAAAYDFVRLGEGLADTLMRAAEEQVTKAQQILDQTKALAEIIRNQVTAQARQIGDMNARFKSFGEHMLDAHRKLNGDPSPRVANQESPDTSASDLVRLHSVAGLRSGRDAASGAGNSSGPDHRAERRRASDPDGYKDL